MKKVVFGMVLGFILSSFTLMFAATTFKTTNNKFEIYKDGAKIKLDAKNINGSTYLKLKDVATLLGIEVEFKDKKIQIVTAPSNKTSDGQEAVYINKVKHVSFDDVEAKMKDAGIDVTISESDSTITVKKNGKSVSQKYVVYFNVRYIPASFYEGNIVPLY